MKKEKIRFVILRETERGTLKNISKDTFDPQIFGFSWEDFVDQVNFLSREGYITKPTYASGTIYFYGSVLTEKGEIYLENSKWYKKAYSTVKEIKDWIK